MNLYDTVKVLETKGIEVAIDLGVHSNCALDSNCPLAIQVRKIITDAGLTLEQMQEGLEVVTNPPNPIHFGLPSFEAKVTMNVSGKAVEIDLSDVISKELYRNVRYKLEDIEGMGREVRHIGTWLYNAYLREIDKARETATLVQLSYPATDLIKAGCMITATRREYLFLFPSIYNPQWIICGSTVYKLADEDIAKLRRVMYLQFRVTPSGVFREVIVLDGEGSKMSHYHGDTGHDCWGHVSLPHRWDKELDSLVKLARSLIISLYTINYGSMVSGHPHGFPVADGLLRRATEVGVEGDPHNPINERTNPAPPATVDMGELHAERHGWGTDPRAQAGGATITYTIGTDPVAPEEPDPADGGATPTIEDLIRGDDEATPVGGTGDEHH